MPATSASHAALHSLNESPSEKEGKSHGIPRVYTFSNGLNESPSEKEGKGTGTLCPRCRLSASMKVPPKRKGNATRK